MTPQEQQLLSAFLQQMEQLPGQVLDTEANQLIQRSLAARPDAPYLLVQKAILQEQALHAAQARIAALENDVRQLQANQNPAPASGGFLGASAWGNSAAAQAPAAPRSVAGYNNSGLPISNYTPVNNQPPAAPARSSGAMGGFLGTAAATAAGVVGGSLLFQGVESLFGHHQSGFGQGGGWFGGDAQNNPENVTVNNYYGDRQDSLMDNGSADFGDIGGDASTMDFGTDDDFS